MCGIVITHPGPNVWNVITYPGPNVWNVITHTGPNANGGLVKPPLKLGYWYVITSNIK